MRRFSSARVFVSVVATIVSQDAIAQEKAPAHLPDNVTQLIQKLDSDNVQVRTEATEQLLTDGSITLKQVEIALRSDALLPEQRQRLNAVAFRRFRSGPHAAMGIRNDQGSGAHGVLVGYLQNGFPAGETLRLNDRITVADGIIIESWEKLRAVIISRDPGDTIPATVVREGATLNLNVKLAEYSRLNQASQIEPMILEDAWTIRSRAFRPPNEAPPPPIDSGVSITDWQRVFPGPDDVTPADFGAADGSRTSVVAGGEPRGGQSPRPNATVLTRNFNNRLGPGQGRFNGPQIAPGLDPVMGPGQARQRQLSQFQQMRDIYAAQLEASNQRLRDPATPESVRETLRNEVTKLVDSIRVLDIQMQAIQEDLNRRPRP